MKKYYQLSISHDRTGTAPAILAGKMKAEGNGIKEVVFWEVIVC